MFARTVILVPSRVSPNENSVDAGLWEDLKSIQNSRVAIFPEPRESEGREMYGTVFPKLKIARPSLTVISGLKWAEPFPTVSKTLKVFLPKESVPVIILESLKEYL